MIIAGVITFSIGLLKIETIEEVNKPMARNLESDISISKTFNLASFQIYDQIISIK